MEVRRERTESKMILEGGGRLKNEEKEWAAGGCWEWSEGRMELKGLDG